MIGRGTPRNIKRIDRIEVSRHGMRFAETPWRRCLT